MKTLRKNSAWLLACAFMLSAVSIAVAQEKPAEKKPENPAPQQQSEPAQQPNAGAAAQGQEGPMRKLAEESREAAGEEGSQFKQSAAVRWLASATKLSPLAAYWVFTAANFAIVAVVIVWALRARLPGWFRGRSQNIQSTIKEAERASAEARTRLAAIESRLARMDQEVAALRSTAEAEGTREEERIHAAAEEDKQKIIAAAEQEIVALSRQAQRELKTYAAALAVQLAEQRVQIDEQTDARLVRDFAGKFSAEGGR